MFIGQFKNNIDAKGRLIVPAKYRDQLDNKIIVARGLDGCLCVYPLSKWQTIENKLASLPNTKKQARAYARMILSSACDLDFDKLGRINLPNHLCQLANLVKKCIIVGVGEYLEIWDEETWLAYNEKIDESFEDIAEELVDFEI
ncbi:MAG: division/cell wall cluster transcriptional repressor MraZ [Bacilli bacterium]|nr:division/cell wall cluster transcriptional repressor MraZ [Bacilli bacterium]